jgi:hypothetical protein
MTYMDLSSLLYSIPWRKCLFLEEKQRLQSMKTLHNQSIYDNQQLKQPLRNRLYFILTWINGFFNYFKKKKHNNDFFI